VWICRLRNFGKLRKKNKKEKEKKGSYNMQISTAQLVKAKNKKENRTYINITKASKRV
jgi:hypothetical protein